MLVYIVYTTDLILALNYLKEVSSFKYQRVTRHMLPHLSGVPHLHVNRP